MRGLPEGVRLANGVGASDASPAPAVVIRPLHDGIAHEDQAKLLA